MEGVTVNVDSGLSGAVEEDHDEAEVRGQAGGRRVQGSSKQIGWDELCVSSVFPRTSIACIGFTPAEDFDELILSYTGALG